MEKYFKSLEWIIKTYEITYDDFLCVPSIFAKYSNIKFVDWILNYYKNPSWFFPIFAKYGKLNYMKLMHLKYFDLIVSVDDATLYACRYGYLKVVQWLVNTFNENITVECINTSIRHGHLKITKWLLNSLGVNYIFNRDVFHTALKNGHLKMILWLVNKFNLTKQDIISHNNSFLMTACSHGRSKIVKWIIRSYKLRENEVKIRNNWGFAVGCSHGHLKIVRWLHKNFNITIDDILYKNKYIIRKLIEKKHNDILEFIILKYGIENLNLTRRQKQYIETM